MDFIASTPRAALWAKPGMGKSVMTLTFLDVWHNVWGESAPTLVLAPLRVARDTWAGEAHKWEHLRGLEVTPVVGTAAERVAALRKDTAVFAINYDNLVWLKEHFEETGRAWPFKMVVADEATKLKNFRIRQGGVRAQALGQVAHKHVERWLNLTGTPSPNGLKDLWGQTWFLDQGKRLGRTYDSFEQRWFGYRRVRDAISGRQDIQPVIFPYASEQIHDALRDICLTLDPKDWFDLQEPIVNVIEVDLPKSARIKYRELERELFFQLESGEEVEVFNAASLSNKCLQLANGAVYLDPERYGKWAWVECHSEKIDALQELVDETGDDPILVAYNFKSDLARLKRAFHEALDLSVADQLAAAQRGEGKMWLGHPASIGHGVDGLQRFCNRIVFFAQDWNLEYHDQIIERIGPMRQYQEGRRDGVYIDYIMAKGTVDEVVTMRRDGKRSVQDHLMDYMKGKK